MLFKSLMDQKRELNKVNSLKSCSKQSKSQTSSFLDTNDPKKRYQEVIREEMENERQQIHNKMEKKRQEEEKMHRKHLQNELMKKKRQLEELEKVKASDEEASKKAFYNAKVKLEKEKIVKMEREIRAQTANKQSRTRYHEAINRLETERQEKNYKHTQAKLTRQIHKEKEQLERTRATRYSKAQQLKKAQQEEAKRQSERKTIIDYQNGLNKHGLHKKLATTSSTNLTTLIIRQKQQEDQASRQAEIVARKKAEQQRRKMEESEKNRRLAHQRGEQALEKMKRQREYEAYCRDVEKQQVKYNLNRVQAGKNNQFAGVKPMTLSQMDLNKKLRSEQQFQEMFIKNPASSLHNQPANKYKMTQIKMKDKPQQVKKIQVWKKQPIDYAEKESLIPQNSEGHYSFEEPNTQSMMEKEEELKIKSRQSNRLQAQPKPIIKEAKETGVPRIIQEVGKTRLKQTRVSNDRPKNVAELNYSDSQQDSNI